MTCRFVSPLQGEGRGSSPSAPTISSAGESTIPFFVFRRLVPKERLGDSSRLTCAYSMKDANPSVRRTTGRHRLVLRILPSRAYWLHPSAPWLGSGTSPDLHQLRRALS